jgi:hypothetical protein
LCGHAMCETMAGMTDDVMADLRSAAKAYRLAKSRLDEARPRLAAAIADAAKANVRQTEIVSVSGYTREQVRRICRDAGVTPSA